jgi:ATP-binding cassette, subfamily C, type I secretion system permease/ATPase
VSKKLSSPILNELRPLLPAYLTLFGFSFFSPILYLASPIFIEQMYDRVMYSRNADTLLVLAAIATYLIVMFCILEWVRKKALARLGNAIDERFSRMLFETLHRASGAARIARSSNILADFNTVRDFLSGFTLTALFDAFWAPLFVVVMTLVHWLFGAIALLLILFTAAITFINHRLTRKDLHNYHQVAFKTHEFSQAISRNVETIRALGMLLPLRDRWYRLHTGMLGWQSAAYVWSEIFTYVIKFTRSYQMIAITAVGTLLYLNNEVTPANTFVAMTLMMRGLGPIDQVISNWKSYSGALAALGRLDDVMRGAGKLAPKLSLPALQGPLVVSRVFAFAPGSERPVLNDVSFTLAEGRTMGIIGPSGAGKSCLARVLVGIWPPRSGTLSIGDHDLSHWNEDELGRRVGYMPQDIELLPGTIAENISRFDAAAEADPSKIIAASELAGVQDLIRSLPDGYNTKVGLDGHVLSGGQRSRIALARAVYGLPTFIVLDEPNSNLDARAEQSFLEMVQKLRAMRASVVIATHKLTTLSCCDDVLVLNAGTVQAFGPREQIVNRIPRLAAAPPLTVIEGAAGARRS